MTTDLAVHQAKIAPEVSIAARTLAVLREFQILTPADYDMAAQGVIDVKRRSKELEATRTGITSPMNEAKRRVDELFRAPLGDLREAERCLKDKIARYHEDQERTRVQVMQASAAEYRAGGTPTAMIPVPPSAPGVTTVQVLDYEITYPELVPRDLCTPDPSLILARVRALDADRWTDGVMKSDIPGVRIFKRQQVRVTT